MNVRQRILILHPNLATGGAEAQVLGFLRHLSVRHDVHLALFEFSDQEIRRLSHLTNISVHPLYKTSGLVSTVAALIKLGKIIRANDITIVKTYLSNTNLLALLLKASKPNLIVVWGLRISRIQRKHDTLKERLVEKCLIRASPIIDLLISNNSSGLKSFRNRGLVPKTAVVIENGIDTSRYFFSKERETKAREAFGADKSTFVIGMVARQAPWKGHLITLRAFKEAKGRISTPKLVMIGDGAREWAEHLRSQTRQLGIEEYVLWLGDRDDVDCLLSGLNVFTLASTSGEGHSNALVEAMATGVPSVVTDVGDNAAIIGANGIVVAPNDPKELANAWCQIATRNAPVEEWRSKNVISVDQRFSETNCYSRMEQALLKICP